MLPSRGRSTSRRSRSRSTSSSKGTRRIDESKSKLCGSHSTCTPVGVRNSESTYRKTGSHMRRDGEKQEKNDEEDTQHIPALVRQRQRQKIVVGVPLGRKADLTSSTPVPRGLNEDTFESENRRSRSRSERGSRSERESEKQKQK